MTMHYREHEARTRYGTVGLEYGIAPHIPPGALTRFKPLARLLNRCWFYLRPRYYREPKLFAYEARVVWLCFWVTVVVMPKWGRR